MQHGILGNLHWRSLKVVVHGNDDFVPRVEDTRKQSIMLPVVPHQVLLNGRSVVWLPSLTNRIGILRDKVACSARDEILLRCWTNNR